MLLWGGEDELECDVSRDMMEDETSRVVNGFVLDVKSLLKYAISGKFGSMCSLKYSMAIVDRSNNSSVTLKGRASIGVVRM